MKKMRLNKVIFDLDGTLIDSASSILSSIRFAFNKMSIEPIRQLTKDIIGPPLKEIFLKLLYEKEYEKIPQLIKLFKCHYDETGYRKTIVYEDVEETVDELIRNGLDLYIATNKRIVPTMKIIEYLGWGGKFAEVYALDYFNPELHSKKEMLKRLHVDLPGLNNNAVYIGDRGEDYEAAMAANIPFIFAEWGYFDCSKINNEISRVKNPKEIPLLLQQLNQ